MTKISIFLFSTIMAFSSYSSEKFWSDIGQGEKLSGKQTISGLVSSIKKKIRARENYYLIDLKDPNSENFVELRIYTIVKNRRINKIDCEENDKLTVNSSFSIKSKKLFQFSKRKNRVGFVTIKKKDKSLECIKPTVEPVKETKKEE